MFHLKVIPVSRFPESDCRAYLLAVLGKGSKLCLAATFLFVIDRLFTAFRMLESIQDAHDTNLGCSDTEIWKDHLDHFQVSEIKSRPADFQIESPADFTKDVLTKHGHAGLMILTFQDNSRHSIGIRDDVIYNPSAVSDSVVIPVTRCENAEKLLAQLLNQLSQSDHNQRLIGLQYLTYKPSIIQAKISA